MHDSIKIVFLLYSDYGKTWARCRLGLTKYSGFDVKPSERIVRIVTYLKSINYNIDDMSDDEVLAIFGVNTNKDILLDDIDIEPTTMNMKTFMRCVIA